MTAPDTNPVPALGALLGRSCPYCGLASRLVAAEGLLGAKCLKCGGVFVADDGLVPVLGTRKRALPPTMPAFEQSLLCPRCEAELHGVLVAGVAGSVCPEGHGAFFDAGRAALFRRLVDGTAPDVVAAGHQTHPPRLSRPGYLVVFTDSAKSAAQQGAGTAASWAAFALVVGLLALAYQLGA